MLLLRTSRGVDPGIPLLRSLGSNAHVWLPGANGTTVASLPSENYLLSDFATLAGVDAVVGGVKDGMNPSGGISLTQATTANKPLVRRGMLNLLTYSNTPTNASWAKTGSTAAPNETTINFPVELEPILNGASVTAPAGSTWTSAFVLSGTGTISIYCARHIGGGYEETALQVALTSTPTLYAVTHTLAGVQTAMRSGITRKTGDTATSVTFGGGGLFKGTWTAAQILAEGGIPTTTATAASNPTSGKYWWSFDGSNDSLLSGNLGITNACTIVIAGRVNSLGATQVLFDEGVNGVQFYISTTGAVVLAKPGAGNVLASSAGVIAAGVPFVLTARLSGGTLVFRNLGVQFATTATAITFSATSGAKIGADFTTGGVLNDALGWVVPLPTALSDADCLTVERLVSSQFPNGPVF